MENPTPLSDTPAKLLNEQLRADAGLREQSVAMVIGGGCLAAIVLIPLLSWGLELEVAMVMALGREAFLGFLAAFVAYYLAVILLVRRGFYHPAIAWLNVIIEVSFPVPFFVTLALKLGPESALGAAISVVWGGLIVLSALRTSPTLCLFAGLLGAFENLVFYFVVIRPAMPEPTVVAFTGGEVMFRSFFLLASGVAGAMIAGHLVRKAEEALRAVRARDLMGKYILHERLGVGGMAEVIRATYCPEGGFEKEVAVKRILAGYSEDEEFVSRFRQEARICAMLQHPNIVQVFDVGRFDGHYFLAMEFVHGLPLHRVIRGLAGDRLPMAAATYVVHEVAAALHYIHTLRTADGEPLRLVHRDLNPPNILISQYGEAKLTDFGVAQAAQSAVLTRADAVPGKLHYLAPEQLDRNQLDGRTDLFALGLILHELLTGKRLLEGDFYGTVKQAVAGPFPAPSASRSEVPPELDELTLQLLECDPSDRPANGAEVVARMAALNGDGAPLPVGRRLLAEAVKEAKKYLARTSPEPKDPKTPRLVALREGKH